MTSRGPLTDRQGRYCSDGTVALAYRCALGSSRRVGPSYKHVCLARLMKSAPRKHKPCFNTCLRPTICDSAPSPIGQHYPIFRSAFCFFQMALRLEGILRSEPHRLRDKEQAKSSRARHPSRFEHVQIRSTCSSHGRRRSTLETLRSGDAKVPVLLYTLASPHATSPSRDLAPARMVVLGAGSCGEQWHLCSQTSIIPPSCSLFFVHCSTNLASLFRRKH